MQLWRLSFHCTSFVKQLYAFQLCRVVSSKICCSPWIRITRRSPHQKGRKGKLDQKVPGRLDLSSHSWLVSSLMFCMKDSLTRIERRSWYFCVSPCPLWTVMTLMYLIKWVVVATVSGPTRPVVRFIIYDGAYGSKARVGKAGNRLQKNP